jgi:prepilin-type processing-associated H-X9-DG protein
MATAALILGITGLILSPFIIGMLIGIVGIILGVVALQRPIRRGFAVAGIITGVISLPVGVFAGLIVLLMPSLGAARMAARETVTMTNMRGIVMAVQMYGVEYGNELPAHLAQLVPVGPTTHSSHLGTYGDTAKWSRDARRNTPPYTPVPGLNLKDRMAEMDAHCDFYYAGAGAIFNRIPHPSSFILLYDHPGAGRRRVVVFADGHVEAIVPGAAVERIADQANRDRAVLKLPPLPRDLSGPPVSAGTLPAGTRASTGLRPESEK